MTQDLSFAVPFSAKDSTFCGMKITFHRNLSGYLFPSKIQADDKVKASSIVISNLKTLFPEATFYPPPLEQDFRDVFLTSLHEISGFFCDPQSQISISCFEQDHLNLSIHTHCLDFKKLYDEIKTYNARLETLFNFAKNPYIGYLSAYPEYSGFGITFEACLFFPHLKEVPVVDSKFSLEPYFGSSRFFVLKTKNIAGTEITNLLPEFLNTIQKIKNASVEATALLFKTHKDLVLDEVSKALALLKGSYRLNFLDAFENLLTLKMGYHLGLLQGINQDCFLELAHKAQKAQLAIYFNKTSSDDDWMHERATWMSETLKSLSLNSSS